MLIDEGLHDSKRRSNSAWAKKRTGQLQDLVGPAQLAHLALEFLDALLLTGRGLLACAAVSVALAHPAPQRLGRAADLARSRLNGRLLRRVLVLGDKDHAHRTLLDLRGKLRGLPHGGSILNRRSHLKSGAVHVDLKNVIDRHG